MKLSPFKTAVIFLILANMIWGAAFPIYKLTLREVPPFTFVFLRFYLGALFLIPFVYNKLEVKRSDWRSLFLVSFVGVTLTISFLVLGLKYTSSINAPIILSSTPIFTIIGSFFYLKEKLRIKIISGTLISLLGVLVIVLLPLFMANGVDGNILGNLFLVLAAIGSTIHVLLLKKISSKYSPLTIAFWEFILGSLPLTPLYFIELQKTHWPAQIHSYSVLGILFGALIATTIAHSIYNFGIKNVKASEVGIFNYVDPLTTIIVAIPLLGEQITSPYILGSILVFFGIFVAEGRIHYHPIHKLFGNR